MRSGFSSIEQREMMKWRKWNNAVHRDLGYLACGLTLAYAVSGIAVNHTHDWNPNYKIEKTRIIIGAIADSSTAVSEDAVQAILEQLGEDGAVTGTYPLNPRTLQVFVDDRSILIDVKTGDVIYEKVTRRTGLYEMNFLHLNHPKKLWTYVADLYAAVLFTLALTGLFVIRGKKGLKGRGAWLVSIGVLIPLFFLWLYL